jgi:hypothetical protein
MSVTDMLKPKRWKSKRYEAWVRTQPCCVCGAPAVEVHHIKGVGFMSGTGLKAPSWAIIPLSNHMHREMHRSKAMQALQWELVARTLGKAIEEGVFK